MSERELFTAVLQIADREERLAYLEKNCPGEEARRRLAELLAAHEALQETQAPRPEAPHAAAGAEELRVIGRYKLLQKLGEGGMGTVWVAEQQEPVKRRVALKLVKAGLDSEQVLRRFEAERQALAMMDHTNIAKVLDAGTIGEPGTRIGEPGASATGGRPFFVMELIKGVPITRYCDELHLPLRERLELFVPVCQAIQHAHQKGVIHRDIKPSNVLVAVEDGKPLPKIIDFGVAKALHQPLAEGTLMTEFGAVVGTLEYMSPEQAELSALDVDTRADVYALGVLLYELLTGSTPLDKSRLRSAAFVELLRIIKEEEPPKPSARLTQAKEELANLAALRRTEPDRLRKEVSGELDWIVMRCLEKDRMRRYESASALARDVQSHLASEPVMACPPSAGYRLRKWAWRNRVAVIFAVTVWLITLTQAGFSTLQWLNARASEQRAREERDRAEQARQSEAAKAAELAKAVGEKSAALRTSEARRLAALAAMKAPTAPELVGPLAREALALENDAIAASTILGALMDLPALRPFEQPPDPSAPPGFRPSWWFAFTPDGKDVVVPCGQAERLAIFDARTGKLKRSFLTPCPRGTWRFTRLSPDGRWLLTAAANTAALWDVAAGARVGLFEHEKGWFGVHAAEFSPDSAHLAALVHENKVDPNGKPVPGRERQVWRLAVPSMEGKLIGSLRDEEPHVLAFSGDGQRLAIAPRGPGQVRVFDLTAGKQLWAQPGEGNLPFPAVSFSQDGTKLASITRKGIKVLDALTGEERADPKLDLPGSTNGATPKVSRDGRWLLVSSTLENNEVGMRGSITESGPMRLFDLKAMRWADSSLKDFPGVYRTVALSADGSRAAALDEHDQTLRVWELPSGRLLNRLRIQGTEAAHFVLSPDGKHAVVQRRDECLQGLSLDGHGLLPGREKKTHDWLLSADGARLFLWNAEAKGALEILEARDLRTVERRIVERPAEPPPGSGSASMALLGDGERLLATFMNDQAMLVDLNARKGLATYERFPYGRVRPMKLTVPRRGGGVFLAAVPTDPKAETFRPSPHDFLLFDAKTGQLRAKLDFGAAATAIRAAAFSADGRRLALLPAWLAAPRQQREAQLWSMIDGKPTGRAAWPFDSEVMGLALNATGTELFAWDGYGRLHAWNADEQKWRHALPEPVVGLRQVAVAPDGQRLATAAEGEIALWETGSGRNLYRVAIDPKADCEIAFVGDGSMLLSVTDAGRFQLLPSDLRCFLEKQDLPPLTAAQRRDLGLTATANPK